MNESERIYAYVLIACVSCAVHAADALQQKTLLDGKVTMLVPASFSKLSDEARRIKYPGTNAPSLVLSNFAGDVNIALDHKSVELKPEQLKDLESGFRQQMAGATINASGIRTINGHQFVVFDMDTPAQDGTIHNLIAMTSHDGRMLVVSYNCSLTKDSACGALGTQLVGSIKLSSKPATQ
jgi:hypothetical protein